MSVISPSGPSLTIEKVTAHHKSSSSRYCLYYIMAGSAAFAAADSSFTLKQEEAVLFRPQNPMPVPSAGRCAEVYCLTVAPDTMHYSMLPCLSSFPLFVQFCTHENGLSDANTCLRFEHSEQPLGSRILQLDQEYHHPGAGSDILLSLELTELLILFLRNYQVRTTINEYPGSALLSRIMQYIMKNYRTASLSDAARQLNYHPNTISAALRSGMGKSFTEILQHIRMNHAISLLLQEELPVEEIARLCGYANAGNFYRAFRKAYGLTPKEYVMEIKAGHLCLSDGTAGFYSP